MYVCDIVLDFLHLESAIQSFFHGSLRLVMWGYMSNCQSRNPCPFPSCSRRNLWPFLDPPSPVQFRMESPWKITWKPLNPKFLTCRANVYSCNLYHKNEYDIVTLAFLSHLESATQTFFHGSLRIVMQGKMYNFLLSNPCCPFPSCSRQEPEAFLELWVLLGFPFTSSV